MEYKYRVIREVSVDTIMQEDGPDSLTNIGSKTHSKEIWNKTFNEEITVDYFDVKIVSYDKDSFTSFKLQKFDDSLNEWKLIGNLKTKIDYSEEDEQEFEVEEQCPICDEPGFSGFCNSCGYPHQRVD